MKRKNILFVPGIKKNLLSISALDAKGMRVAFVDGQVLMWPKGNNFGDAMEEWSNERMEFFASFST